MTVQGLGGAFLYAKDAQVLSQWYTEHLGLKLNKWGPCFGLEFPSKDIDETGLQASTTFSIFQHDKPETMKAKTARLNFRVSDLASMLEKLKKAGVKVDDNEEKSEYGWFAWAYDPEDNKVELWQPPAASDD